MNIKKIFKMRIFLSALLIFSFTATCTNNPFFGDDDNPQNNLTLKGRVLLSDENTHSGIFVWLEGLNQYTRTDSLGNFVLKIEAPEKLPGGALAWNGLFKVYFFLANYRIKTTEVFIRDGEFLFNRNDLDEKGNLLRDIILSPLVKFETSIEPNPVNEGTLEQRIYINIKITPVIDEPLKINTYLNSEGVIQSFFLKRIDGPISASYIFLLFPHDYYEEFTFSNPIETTIQWYSTGLRAGKYKVVPYMKIHQNNLPNELVLASEAGEEFNFDYLKLPLFMDAKPFTILERR